MMLLGNDVSICFRRSAHVDRVQGDIVQGTKILAAGKPLPVINSTLYLDLLGYYPTGRAMASTLARR